VNGMRRVAKPTLTKGLKRKIQTINNLRLAFRMHKGGHGSQ
jgi:hypothetical protein